MLAAQLKTRSSFHVHAAPIVIRSAHDGAVCSVDKLAANVATQLLGQQRLNAASVWLSQPEWTATLRRILPVSAQIYGTTTGHALQRELQHCSEPSLYLSAAIEAPTPPARARAACSEALSTAYPHWLRNAVSDGLYTSQAEHFVAETSAGQIRALEFFVPKRKPLLSGDRTASLAPIAGGWSVVGTVLGPTIAGSGRSQRQNISVEFCAPALAAMNRQYELATHIAAWLEEQQAPAAAAWRRVEISATEHDLAAAAYALAARLGVAESKLSGCDLKNGWQQLAGPLESIATPQLPSAYLRWTSPDSLWVSLTWE